MKASVPGRRLQRRARWPLRHPLTVFGAALRHAPARGLDRATAQGVDLNRPLRPSHRRDVPLLRTLKSWSKSPSLASRIARLLALGASAQRTDAYGTPPLWWAAYHRRWGSALALLQHGASTMDDSTGPEHPWILAVETAQVEVVRAMLERGFNVNHATGRGITGLFRLAFPSVDDHGVRFVAQDRKVQTLDLLHAHGLLVNPVDPERSPIARVVRAPAGVFEAEVFDWFVTHGVDLEVRLPHPLARFQPLRRPTPSGDSGERYDESGWSLLHLAARSGNLDGVQRLLELGVDPVARTSADRTPLDVARDHDHPAVMACLERFALHQALNGHASGVLTPPRGGRGRSRL